MAPLRHYELILLGATGYTGKLTAEWISQHLPTDLKWAIAGRNQKKLQDVVDELKRLNPDRKQPGKLSPRVVNGCISTFSQLHSTASPTLFVDRNPKWP